jgi:type VI secretion system protein ImpL
MTLKQDAQEQMSTALDLRNEVGPAFDVVYRPVAISAHEAAQERIALPFLLTAKGYRDYFEPNSEGVTDLAMIDQWVLGERRRIDYSEEDRKALAQRLRTLYEADYVDSWRRALNLFSVTDFRDLPHAVTVLQHVTGPAAPLRRLLETVRDNSELYPSIPMAEGQVAVLTAAQEAGPQQGVGIRRAFAGLSELLVAKGDKPTYYEEILGAVNAVHDYTKAVNDSPDRGKAALVTVLNRFSLTGVDPISTLQRLATGLPEPVNLQVKKLADQTAQVLVIEALRELEKRWDTDVYSFYQQRLGGRYPFTANGSDASLEDFEAFFGPQGRLQQFHDQYLKVFIKDNLDALYSDNRGGYLVRTEVLEQLQAAARIRETFQQSRCPGRAVQS